MKAHSLPRSKYQHNWASRILNVRRKKVARTLLFEQMEDRRMLDASPWHNLAMPADVDANGLVNSSDANIIQGMLDANGGNPISVPTNGSGPPYADANSDWIVNQNDWTFVTWMGGGIPPSTPPGSPPPSGPPTYPPTVTITSIPGSVNEMQVFTFGGTFTWAYYLDVKSVGSEFHMLGGTFPGGASGNWTVTGYFRDDNGSNTSSDVRTIKIEVGNATLFKGIVYTSTTVVNLPPTSIQVFSAPEGFDEAQEATISVVALGGYNAYTNSPASDTYGWTIDWGDGHTDTIEPPPDVPTPQSGLLFLSPGATAPQPPNPPLTVPAWNIGTFGGRHTYLDDDPTGTPQDYYTVHVTLTDDDTGSASGSGPVLIKNVKPTVAITGAVADNTLPPSTDGDSVPWLLEEGEWFKVTGTIYDVGVLDSHDGVIKVDSNSDGDMDDPGESSPITTITPAGTPGVWTFEGFSPPIPDDGPSAQTASDWESNHTKFDSIPFRVEVYDDDMLRAPSGTPVVANSNTTVHNIPPKIKSAVGAVKSQSHGRWA